MSAFFQLFFAALKNAFTFDAPDAPVIERATRRYFGLAFLALAAVLSTWMWTLDSASYATVLDDLLERHIASTGDELDFARPWAFGFYAADSLLFIGCYVGFSIVMARLLGKLLTADSSIDSSGNPHGVVSWISKHLLRGTKLLLWALVISDAVENVSAMIMLWYGEPIATLSTTFVTGTRLKGLFEGLLMLWLVGTVLIWLLGGSIPSGESAALRDARRVRRDVRNGLADVLSRTRYCLLIVVAYAVLMLGIDQAEDVLGGLAAFLTAEFREALVLLGAVALGVLALHTHAHSIWVWVRLLVRLRRSDDPDSAAAAAGATFSKWWGRLLGAAPWFIVAVLCVRTAGQASQVGAVSTSWMLLLAGALSSAWGVGFVLWKERESKQLHRSGVPYYAAATNEADLLKDNAYRFLRYIRPSPVWIPLVAVAGIFLIRLLYVFMPTSTACNALAAISFSFALWTCVINRLALNSLRSRIPWVLGLVMLIAVLAGAGLTQNHGVLAGGNLARTGQGLASLQIMFVYSTLLAAGAVAAYLLWTRHLLAKPDISRSDRERAVATHRRMWVSWAVVAVLTSAVLFVGSRGQEQEAAPQARLPERKSLQQAVNDWLRERLIECGDQCAHIPVYLVSAEGGGIRAAYYTAQLLAQLSTVEQLALPRHVFSLSGVSGGSLGVTGWRLCMNDPKTPGCVQPLGEVDLLTPLASAWMFEDALALLIPTGKCALPGCGFVDRASWFERSLEKSHVGFAQPLPPDAPYLFLNSTWVETGERAIASSVEIETRLCVDLRQAAVRTGQFDQAWQDKCHPEFPTARDQLFEIGANVRASTLAHNSARFPFFNPIGYVRDWGHLADGGYFDNSGTQTTADILNEFVRQLTCDRSGCPPALPRDPSDKPLKDPLTAKEKTTLRAKVAITAIMIRNGVRISSDPAESHCAAPRARKSQALFANAAGPLITALNATGIGTPNRVAQCNLQRMLTRLNGKLDMQLGAGGYVDVRLVSKDTLYPLGWYLSMSARTGIEQAAIDCVHGQKLAADLITPGKSEANLESHACFDRVKSGVPPPTSEGE